jgi:GTP-binding protein HflX
MSSPSETARPKAVRVGVQLPGVTNAEQRSSLMELKRLCKTLGFEVVGEVTQKRKSLGAATLVGEGKLVELAAWTGGTGVVPTDPPARRNRRKKTRTRPSRSTSTRRRRRPGNRARPSSSSTTSCRLASSTTSSARPRPRRSSIARA